MQIKGGCIYQVASESFLGIPRYSRQGWQNEKKNTGNCGALCVSRKRKNRQKDRQLIVLVNIFD